MSTQSNVPAPAETYQVEPGGTPRWIILVLAVLVVGMGYLIYAQSASRKALEDEVASANKRADLLAGKIEQADSRIADLKGQLDVTSQKLGLTEAELARARDIAQNVRKQQAVSEKELTAKIGEVQQQNEAKLSAVSADLSGTKTDVAATKKDLEATKARMERAVGDMNVMSGLIARNKEEVEELKRRGERNIYDFDVTKSKDPQHVGPILIKLKKVDPKHSKYTMDVIADDKTIEKKDKNALEPVQFYTRSAHQLYEIVVFDTGKNKISGYLSTPKQ
jgi:predicted  nucleic acid-binding Zn-ribbon protein